MTNKSGRIGTAGETAVVRQLVVRNWPNAERRRLKGNLDEGDITGCPGICIEVKAGKAAASASDKQIADWMNELASETINARAEHGILVVKRKGIGEDNADRWHTYLTLGTLVDLVSGGRTWPGVDVDLRDIPLRMTLDDACQVLARAGYGEPIENWPLTSEIIKA